MGGNKMLESLHVKNLALIDETEVEFTEGLNILTGETGAGKSVIIGSVNLALGAKADKEIIRTGAEYALVELVFSLDENQRNAVRDMELPLEDNILILQRKIMAGRSICRVNGETVTAGQLRALSGTLLDMYGQHEHQSLLKASRHRELLDGYAGKEMAVLKESLKELYKRYKKTEEELKANSLDDSARNREMDLLSFEVKEIEAAGLTLNEDEELEKNYRRMSNARQLKEAVFAVHALTGYEDGESAGEAIGRALREMRPVSSYDEELSGLIGQLEDIDNLLNDFNRSLADYRDSLEFNEEEFIQTEERLNMINRFKEKYGGTIGEILDSCEEKQKRLQHLESYEEYVNLLHTRYEEEKKQLLSLCSEISALRKETAERLSGKLTEALKALNFMEVDFSIDVEAEEEHFTEEGYDRIQFMISTNPGEKKKPLADVASGGELSRIMLAFKTVFADEEGTHTLIFDEIDTGISGRTAWKVSEKLGQLADNHQIICITHLPQIAAMADSHYLIEKQVKQERTVTEIKRLDEEESLGELARLLGSGRVTEAVLTNAREMKAMAQKTKN
jgi:DNA repair protein RecN (Recombination protein N)